MAADGHQALRLSEAIRLGAMLKPQAFGVERGSERVPGWRGWLLSERRDTTCAFFAALDARPCGIKRVPADLETDALRGARRAADTNGTTLVLDIPAEWSVLYVQRSCPACHGAAVSVFRLISHLNDTHRWTREAIADWVQTIEDAQQPQFDQPAPVAVEG